MMRIRSYVLSIFFCFINLVVAKNLEEVALENGLATLLFAAGLTGQSAAFLLPDELTVFAPSDAAFDALPVGALEYLVKPENVNILADILGYHIVVGTVLSTELDDGMDVESLTNEMLMISVDNGMIFVNGATVGPADQMATNGVIHVIDQVLIPPKLELPPDLVDTVIANKKFETLVTALMMAEFVDDLRGGPFTVFAPTDDAFDALPDGVLASLMANVTLLQQVLLYHVSDGEISELLDGQEITTLGGEKITVSIEDSDDKDSDDEDSDDEDAGTVVLNGAATVKCDAVVALNGVIYVIDEVLIPPGF